MRIVASTLAVVLVVATAVIACAEDDDPTALVGRLPYDQDVPSRAARAEDIITALAALGDAAVPALEREMHLELRGRDGQAFTDSGESKRQAAIRALGAIDTDRSTSVLVDTVRAFPDFNGLTDAVIHALGARRLSDAHLERLIRSACPSAVVFALRKAGTIGTGSALRASAQTVFQPDLARQQFRNVFGAQIGGEEAIWQVRLAAGRALGVDVVPDMRRRAYSLVGDLDAASRGDLAGPSAELSSLSQVELDIASAIDRLVELGDPVRDIVGNARKTAAGEFAVVLDCALLTCGERDRLDAVAATLVDSPHASLRVCAARALRGAKDRRTVPAWWKALADPFHRESAGCVRRPGDDGQFYPVRAIAADALIELGEDAKLVRQKERAR